MTTEEIIIINGFKTSVVNIEDWKNLMKEFAKYHVQKALEAAAENAYCDLEHPDDDNDLEESEIIVIKSSILDSYSLDNIK